MGCASVWAPAVLWASRVAGIVTLAILFSPRRKRT